MNVEMELPVIKFRLMHNFGRKYGVAVCVDIYGCIIHHTISL
jgi:hypothetical protein